MLFDDGATQIEVFPTSYDVAAADFSALHFAQTGDVIAAAAPGGVAPRRTRRISLILTTAELATLQAFFDTNDGTSFEFTDDVGRIWDVKWLGDFRSTELTWATDGHYSADLSLFLEGVNSDAGRIAYGNADVSQMSIQKSGASELHFPLAYRPPLPRTDVAAANKILTQTKLAVDAGRYTARRTHRFDFGGLSAAFVSELEDYYHTILEGATSPFSLVHFRDSTRDYRWQQGLRFSMQDGGSYDGGFSAIEEI